MFGKPDCGLRMGALPQNWGPRFTLYHAATFKTNIGNLFSCVGWTAFKRKVLFLPHIFLTLMSSVNQLVSYNDFSIKICRFAVLSKSNMKLLFWMNSVLEIFILCNLFIVSFSKTELRTYGPLQKLKTWIWLKEYFLTRTVKVSLWVESGWRLRRA